MNVVATADSTRALPLRRTLAHADVAAIRALVVTAGNFSVEEVEIATELASERLARGSASGYEFLLYEADRHLLGYACYGPIPGTVARYDVYWVVVDPAQQGQGIGRLLVAAVELAVRDAGGERIYIDTSTSPPYDTARAFYRRLGYVEAAVLPDFYRAGDGKVVFMKHLA